MAATTKDIADRVGLSRPSVSRILNDTAGFRVSPETRRRVLDMAAEMNYRPNAIAQSLRSRHTNIIGFYSGYGDIDVFDPFTAEVVHGMKSAAEALDKDILMHGKVGGRSDDDIYRELVNGKIDGLILLSPPGNPLVQLLSDSSLPVVLIADAIPSLPSVVVDDKAGSYLLGQYLARKGHKRVLYRKSALNTASDIRRLNAFRDCAAAEGITVMAVTESRWREGLSESEMALLQKPEGERPTAIVCWNDGVAYWAIGACLAMELRVPEDVAVVGFDGCEARIPAVHRLTTIRAHWRNVAHKAVELLNNRFNGGEIPTETVLPVELVIGDTT